MKKLTTEQKEKIRIQIGVIGGREEWDDIVFENICAIVEGQKPQIPKKRGRLRLTMAELDCTIGEIRGLHRRNRHLISDRSISSALDTDRRRIVRALKIIEQREVQRAFTVFGWRSRRVKSPLSK